jgi:hypothetical protein
LRSISASHAVTTSRSIACATSTGPIPDHVLSATCGRGRDRSDPSPKRKGLCRGSARAGRRPSRSLATRVEKMLHRLLVLTLRSAGVANDRT